VESAEPAVEEVRVEQLTEQETMLPLVRDERAASVECGTGRQTEREDLFFVSSEWTPVQVPPACKGKPPPVATLEARAIDDHEALRAVGPALAACMARHGIGDVLRMAVEIDSATGCVSAAAARTALKNQALDECVAHALSHAVFEPSIKPNRRQIAFAPEQADEAAHSSTYHQLQRPLQLVPVASECASAKGSPTEKPPTQNEIENALALAEPNLRRCIDLDEVYGPLDVIFNVHGPTGRIVAAVAMTAPKIADIDACVAEAFARTCFPPFEAPSESYPYWTQSHTIFLRPEEALTPVTTTCSTRRPPLAQETSATSFSQLKTRLEERVPRLRGCLEKHGFDKTEHAFVHIDIDAETGTIVRAGADYLPKRIAVDSCIAKALGDVCFAPLAARTPLVRWRFAILAAGTNQTSAAAPLKLLPR
jgi:hypothetical protein